MCSEFHTGLFSGDVHLSAHWKMPAHPVQPSHSLFSGRIKSSCFLEEEKSHFIRNSTEWSGTGVKQYLQKHFHTCYHLFSCGCRTKKCPVLDRQSFCSYTFQCWYLPRAYWWFCSLDCGQEIAWVPDLLGFVKKVLFLQRCCF